VTKWIETQLDVLFARDAQGRLVATRDPTARPAPRFHLGRSAEGNAWATHRDLDAATRDVLESLFAAEPPLLAPSAAARPACYARVLEIVGAFTAEYRGPVYVLPRDLPLDARAREIAEDEVAACAAAFPWLADEFPAIAPVAVAFEGGEPASICHAPRGCTAAAAEAGVETLPAFRGRGLATAAVACWAHAVQRSGRVAFYGASWENAASRAVARRLAARLVGEDWNLT
jgi:hypothetical protein